MAYSERPKLPPRPMINGVFTFLSQMGTIVWTCALSIGAAVLIGLLGMAIVAGMASGGGGMSRRDALDQQHVVEWPVRLRLGALARRRVRRSFSVFFKIPPPATRRSKNWPDVVWLDWIGDSFYLISRASPGSAAIGFGATWLCGGVGGPLMLVFIPLALYLLFPIMLLSTLEMQSPILPISPVVLRSI